MFRNIGEWDKDPGIVARGTNVYSLNCQYINPKLKEPTRGAIFVRGGGLEIKLCDFHNLKTLPYHGIIEARDSKAYSTFC